ncbi:MAG TPA: polymer-forming cytoskeletal protein [Syntrophales bacterium]|nr:polymer-forming cytoskeletal protein [Syntrophales bacterium]
MKISMVCFLVALLLFSFGAPCQAENTNIVKIGGDVTIAEGNKVKNALTVGGQITVNGTVTGHVMAIGGSVVLTRTALVEGNVISVGGVIVMGKGARVHGNSKEINASDISQSIASVLNEDWEGWSWVFAVLSLLIFIGILLLAILLVTLLPKPVCLVATAIRESPFRVFLLGLLVLISIVPLAVLLTISVMGIVLIPLEMTLVVGSALVGFIAVAQLTGEKIFLFFKKPDQSIVIDVSLGLIILWLVGWMPDIGWMIKVIAVVLGLGGVFVSCLGARQKWKKSHMHGEETDGGETSIS